MDNPILAFQSGVQNLIRDEIIKEDAAQDELNWLTQDAKLKLMFGRINLGTEGAVGMISGLWKGLTAQGVSVYFRKTSTKVQYWTGSTWSDVITGLTANADYCFQNYSSLAGAFVYLSGIDGMYKINLANPGNYLSLYNSGINDTGFFLIDKGRMIMWNCKHASKTTLKLSYKDPQDSRVYTTVTAEATASLGGTLKAKGGVFTVTIAGPAVFSKTAHGLLAGDAVVFSTTGALPTGLVAGTTYYVIAGGLTADAFEVSATFGGSAVTTSGSQSGTHTVTQTTRNVFGLVLTITGSGEVYTDNGDGTLTGSAAGTGTINYTTGVYTLSASGVGTVNYFWEDSNRAGITDFRYTVPVRVASEGAIVTQNEGGDAILSVKIGQDGNYYSLKSQSAYFLQVASDDTTIQNNVYRRDIGVPFFGAVDSTSKGILFINTANPDKPEFTILQRNPVGDNIEPVNLFPQFKFANYNFSDAFVFTTERYVIISCRDIASGALINNRILLCDMAQGSVDVAAYSARMFIKDAGTLYTGSPVSESVYKLFNGFDDMGSPLVNYWISRGDQYTNLKVRSAKWRFVAEALKKFRRLRFQGLISINQELQVYCSFDDAGFQLVGTILGKGTYVDYTNAQAIGDNMIGEIQVGGDDPAVAYPYMVELKVKCPKFRKRTLMLVATGVGYVDVEKIMDWDIMVFENRIPKRFRSKQHVSLDGTQTDQNNFPN